MRKIFTSLLLVVLFCGAGSAQDYIQKYHFPKGFYKVYFEDDEYYQDYSWHTISPYEEILAQYHVSEIHIAHSDYYGDIDSTIFYLNRNGITDSIKQFYDPANLKSGYWLCSTKYNSNGKLIYYKSQRVKTDKENTSPFEMSIIYKNGIPVKSVQIHETCDKKTDTINCEYTYYPNNDPWNRVHIETIYSDTCLTKDDIIYDLGFLPLYLFEENNDSIIFQTKGNYTDVYFFNELNQITTESHFSMRNERMVLESYLEYRWKYNGILESCIRTQYYSVLRNDTFCFISYNENNLPLTLKTNLDHYDYYYVYDSDLYRWSDCNFRSKAETEEWVDFIEKEIDNNEKVHFYKKSGTFYYKPFSSDSILLKKTDQEGSYWFRNDYLIKADLNNGYTFWYEKDTLVGYELYPKPRKVNHQKILKEAAEVMNRLHDEISQIDKYFGLRVHISGYYPILSKPSFNNTITIKRSEIENLKDILCDKEDYSITSYSAIFANWAGDLLSLPINGNKITDQVMNYIQASRKRCFLEYIKVVDNNGELVREFDLTISIIDD